MGDGHRRGRGRAEHHFLPAFFGLGARFVARLLSLKLCRADSGRRWRPTPTTIPSSSASSRPSDLAHTRAVGRARTGLRAPSPVGGRPDRRLAGRPRRRAARAAPLRRRPAQRLDVRGGRRHRMAARIFRQLRSCLRVQSRRRRRRRAGHIRRPRLWTQNCTCRSSSVLRCSRRWSALAVSGTKLAVGVAGAPARRGLTLWDLPPTGPSLALLRSLRAGGAAISDSRALGAAHLRFSRERWWVEAKLAASSALTPTRTVWTSAVQRTPPRVAAADSARR